MNEQINLRWPSALVKDTKSFAKKHGYTSVQAFITETVREQVYDKHEISKKELELTLQLLKKSEEGNLLETKEDLMKRLRKNAKSGKLPK